MRGLHWVVSAGLWALPLCEFCKHKIVRPFSTPKCPWLANKRSRSLWKVGWPVECVDAGLPNWGFQSLPAFVPCFNPKLKSAYCQTSGKSTHKQNERSQWETGHRKVRASSSWNKVKIQGAARKSERARSGLNASTSCLTSLALSSFILNS